MERNLILLVLAAVAGTALLVHCPVYAQDDDSADLNVIEEVTEEAPDSTDPLTDVVTSVGEVGAALGAVEDAEDKTSKAMAVCVLIGIILKIVLSVFKLLPVALFKNKHFLKIFPLAVGLAIFLLTAFGTGETWYNALIMAAGGPGAILFHEVWKLAPVGQDKKG